MRTTTQDEVKRLLYSCSASKTACTSAHIIIMTTCPIHTRTHALKYVYITPRQEKKNLSNLNLPFHIGRDWTCKIAEVDIIFDYFWMLFRHTHVHIIYRVSYNSCPIRFYDLNESIGQDIGHWTPLISHGII